jgi:hypothetical protein
MAFRKNATATKNRVGYFIDNCQAFLLGFFREVNMMIPASKPQHKLIADN